MLRRNRYYRSVCRCSPMEQWGIAEVLKRPKKQWRLNGSQASMAPLDNESGLRNVPGQLPWCHKNWGISTGSINWLHISSKWYCPCTLQKWTELMNISLALEEKKKKKPRVGNGSQQMCWIRLNGPPLSDWSESSEYNCHEGKKIKALGVGTRHDAAFGIVKLFSGDSCWQGILPSQMVLTQTKHDDEGCARWASTRARVLRGANEHFATSHRSNRDLPMLVRRDGHESWISSRKSPK